jgi:DNA helicase HerA-like ATPase
MINIVKNYKIGEHLFGVGRTGSGKSYTICDQIKRVLKDNYIIFDIKGEDFNHLGCHVVTSYKGLFEAIKQKKTRILYKDEYLSKNMLNRCLELIYKVCSNITVIVDEIHNFVTKTKILKWIQQFVKVGRSKGKGFWAISQRGQDIHNDILTQSTHKLCGKVSPEDEEYMSKKMGLKKYNVTIDDLGMHEFWYLRDEAGENPNVFKV